MKQTEILQLSQSIAVLNGKGSIRLKWAVYRTTDKLDEATKQIKSFIDEMKPDSLKKLQVEQQKILQKCKTEEERKTEMLNWSKADQLQTEIKKFVESKKYTEFMDSDNNDFKPYPLKLEKEDIEGVDFNNEAFWVLEKITSGLEKLMQEIN